MFSLFVIVDLIIAASSFLLYGRARMKEDKTRERFYLRIHSIALFILLLTGIIYLMLMVEADN